MTGAATVKRGQHVGGNNGGIIWTPHPPKPASPRRRQRSAEWSLIVELGTLAAEVWADHAKGQGDDTEPLAMLWALTRWFCSIELPGTNAELIDGPPLLERRRVEA